MKARTKLEREVTYLSQYLPKISKDISQWSFNEVLDHLAYQNKRSAFCLSCGNPIPIASIHRKRCTCINCGRKLKVVSTHKRTAHQKRMFALAEVYHGFQIIRHFKIEGRSKKGENTTYHTREVLQEWIREDGKITYLGFVHTLNYHVDTWSGDWSIRKESRYSWHGLKYNLYPDKYYPGSVFREDLKQMGIDHKLCFVNVRDVLKIVPQNPKAETLLKQKAYPLLSLACHNSWFLNYYWSSIKITFRNKYRIKDAQMWIDYLAFLEYFKKDLFNAFYVCPKNLKQQHDRLLRKKRLREQKLEKERRQKQRERNERIYAKKIAPFKGLEFHHPPFSFNIIDSVAEFESEGNELNHCVYNCEYYLKPDSLILSAKKDGQRLETVEVNLPDLSILQCRGNHNQNSEHHDEILSIMTHYGLKHIAERMEMESSIV